jgi:glycogen debranching enzyme
MIALPGLLLVTGRHREAKAILRTYARALDRGMLPSHLPEGSERPDFDSVDATLWFFVAIFRYLQYTGDFDFVKTELRIPMLETIRYYGEGTRAGIRVDGDGMLRCGEPGRSLTWMTRISASSRSRNVRASRSSERSLVQRATYYGALGRALLDSERHGALRTHGGKDRRKLPVGLLEQRCWLSLRRGRSFGSRCSDSPEPDPRRQPAVSAFGQRERPERRACRRREAPRPMGLRSLEPNHPDFKGVYDGDPRQRDGSLHQGTVWAWWMGPYISALVKANGAAGRMEAAKLLKPFEQHLCEDGLGHISEIFWGNAPHWPRGLSGACSRAGPKSCAPTTRTSWAAIPAVIRACTSRQLRAR